MISLRTRITLVLFALASSAAGRLFDDDNLSGDICYICNCNDDGAEVDCSQRGLTDIPDGINEKVVKLNISYNEIALLSQNILRRLTNLISLDLSANHIKELPKEILYNLTSLEELNLSRNNFEAWLDLHPSEVFQSTPNLRVLDLSHNKFKTLANLANQELIISSSLETLILDNCEITSIHGRSPISLLTNIRSLQLNHNPLRRIQSLISSTLKSLHVSYCELMTINPNELLFLPLLIYLDVSHNHRLDLSNTATVVYSQSLRFLDISYCNIMYSTIQGFPNLKKAVMHHNIIRYLRSDEFTSNTKLEYLDLSYNSIGSLKSDTFRGLSKLKYLDLSWNEIAEIPEDTLQEMPSVTQIGLARNYLTRVGHLKSYSVKILDMSSCEISTIGKDSLEGLQSLVDLDLSHNLLSRIPDSISSNTLKHFNLNYNRISIINNFTFFMLPRLTSLSVVGNRFTTIWSRSYFETNLYLDRLDLSDNMWRCECRDANMFDFYEFITLEPGKKEESYNLLCNSPVEFTGQLWIEACYFKWYPSERVNNPDNLLWFIIVMISGLALCFIVVNCIKMAMKKRLDAIQEERQRQVEEARDRLRQLRMRSEQEALCNAPDPRDLVSPPSYDEALSMPKLTTSCHSLCEPGSAKSKRRRGRRKTKSSGDLLDETERNGDIPAVDDLELTESSDNRRRRRRRRSRKYGSHEIADLDQSPGVRRRRMSEYGADTEESVTVEVEAEVERPRRPLQLVARRYSSGDDEPRESDF